LQILVSFYVLCDGRGPGFHGVAVSNPLDALEAAVTEETAVPTVGDIMVSVTHTYANWATVDIANKLTGVAGVPVLAHMYPGRLSEGTYIVSSHPHRHPPSDQPEKRVLILHCKFYTNVNNLYLQGFCETLIAREGLVVADEVKDKENINHRYV